VKLPPPYRRRRSARDWTLCAIVNGTVALGLAIAGIAGGRVFSVVIAVIPLIGCVLCLAALRQQHGGR
jgi:hypothetical protein